MLTDSIWAYQVENNDFVVVDGEVIGYVYMVEEKGDGFVFDLVNEDGDHTPYPAGPFETVTIVASFEDGETEDWIDSFQSA